MLCFLEASDVYERLLALERVQGMVGMNRRINRNLENIIFYDEGGNLIFALGNVFLDKPDLELNEMLNFSGRMWDDASKQACFEVGLPVYKEDVGGYTLLGLSLIHIFRRRIRKALRGCARLMRWLWSWRRKRIPGK